MILSKKNNIKRKILQNKIIEKKIFLGNHLGFCKNKNFSGPIQTSIVGVRGGILVRKNLMTHRSFLKTLLFLLRLLKKRGRLLVVETGETFISSFSLLSFISDIQCHSNISYNRSLPTKYTKFMRKWKNFPAPQKEFAWGEEKWFGGTLTNWDEISKKIFQFATLFKEIGGGAAPSFSSRYEKWMKGFPGFFSFHQREGDAILKVRETSSIKLRLGKKVDGILCLYPDEQKDVIAEARLLKIPVIAFADSNTNLSDVDYYLPINFSSSQEVFLFLTLLFQLGERLLKNENDIRY
jgi:hypothetical protein